VKLKFCVITDVGDGQEGNLADVFLTSDGKETYINLSREGLNVVGQAKMPVFVRGEFLVLSESGREISGHGRKPEKWFVTYELYGDPMAALRRAVQVTDSPEDQPVPPPLDTPDHVQTADATRHDVEAFAAIIAEIPKEELDKHPFVQSMKAACTDENSKGVHLIQGGMQDFKKWVKEWKAKNGGEIRTREDP